jgi:uncharacterized iron-regulated membrane protein
MINRKRLRRWHIWLGWIIGIPMLLWTVSGIVMVAKPIEEVRGTHLMADPRPMQLTAPMVPPRLDGLPLASLSLQPRAAGPRWVVALEDGTTRLADPATGALMPALSAADAVREVMARYTGNAKVAAVTRTDRDNPPLDFRRPVAAWQVRMSDGTHFYVDSGSGEVVARRTRWWRFYDLMWGLHIMDPAGREDTHNPWIIGFALVSMVTVILAVVLLPLTIRRNRRNGEARLGG